MHLSGTEGWRVAQPIAEALLSQALLPILEAGDAVSMQPVSVDATSAALRWTVSEPGTVAPGSSTEDALLAVLRFVTGAAPVGRLHALLAWALILGQSPARLCPGCCRSASVCVQ